MTSEGSKGLTTFLPEDSDLFAQITNFIWLTNQANQIQNNERNDFGPILDSLWRHLIHVKWEKWFFLFVGLFF